MATRKRTSRRTGIVGRAVSAGRSALREAEKRIPPDLRRQLDRRLKDADKTARAAIKQLQVQVKKASTRADVNSALKRIDDLTRQARQIARGGSAPSAATAGRRATTTRTAKRRPATRASKPAVATRKAAAPTRKRATTPARRAAAPRRRARAVEPEPDMVVIEEDTPVEIDEIDVIEVSES